MQSTALLLYVPWRDIGLLIPPLYHLAAFGLPQPFFLNLIGRSEGQPVDRLDMVPEVVQVLKLFVLALRWYTLSSCCVLLVRIFSVSSRISASHSRP